MAKATATPRAALNGPLTSLCFARRCFAGSLRSLPQNIKPGHAAAARPPCSVAALARPSAGRRLSMQVWGCALRAFALTPDQGGRVARRAGALPPTKVLPHSLRCAPVGNAAKLSRPPPPGCTWTGGFAPQPAHSLRYAPVDNGRVGSPLVASSA